VQNILPGGRSGKECHRVPQQHRHFLNDWQQPQQPKQPEQLI